MTVNEVAKAMNASKVKVKSKRLIFLRGYYLSMYRVYMVRLFDDCYISDPTVFNEKELFRNIAELGIPDMFSNSGGLRLTYKQARFAYLKATDETKKEFLLNLMNALKYREMCFDVDKMYESCGFREAATNRIRLGLFLQGAMISVKSGIEFNQATAECMTEFEDDVRTINFNEYIWCLAMHELGIPKEDWQQDGLLDGKLSHEAEVECAEGILNGYFKVTGGKYTDKLLSWLKEHPWGDGRMSHDTKGLFDYIFIDRFYEVNSVIDALTNVVIEDKDSVLLGVYGSKVYYRQKRTSFNVPIGLFQVLNTSEEDEMLLSPGANVQGITGEFYTVDRLEEDGTGYVGCPMLLDLGKESVFVYDREQTDLKFESWYSYNNAVFSFDEDEANSASRSPYVIGTVSDELYKGYVNSLRSSAGLISTLSVGTLAQYEQAKKDVWKFIEGVRK